MVIGHNTVASFSHGASAAFRCQTFSVDNWPSVYLAQAIGPILARCTGISSLFEIDGHYGEALRKLRGGRSRECLARGEQLASLEWTGRAGDLRHHPYCVAHPQVRQLAVFSHTVNRRAANPQYRGQLPDGHHQSNAPMSTNISGTTRRRLVHDHSAT